MNRSEKVFDRDELPVHQYKLSKHAIELFGETVSNKGVNVQTVLLYPHFVSFRNKVTELERLIVSPQNKEGLVEYRTVIPKTGEIKQISEF